MEIVQSLRGFKGLCTDSKLCLEWATRKMRAVTKAIATGIVLPVLGSLVQGCQSTEVKVEQPQPVESIIVEPTPEQRAAEERQKALLAENAFTHETGIHAASACQRFIRRRLRDPESVRFPTEPDSASVRRHVDGAYRAELEIRAIDSVDGTTISFFDCEVVKINDDWMLAKLKEHLPG